jgi:poly(3-hydroxybutyrate) depolymerase
VLLVAALAGHFSTLLRNSIRSLVADFDVYVTDVYVTDRHNARDVPAIDGRFGLGDCIGDIIGIPSTSCPGLISRCLSALSGRMSGSDMTAST